MMKAARSTGNATKAPSKGLTALAGSLRILARQPVATGSERADNVAVAHAELNWQLAQAHIRDLRNSAEKPGAAVHRRPHPTCRVRCWVGRSLLRWGIALLAAEPDAAVVGSDRVL